MADWDSYGEVSAEALYAMGLRKEDVVVVAFGYGPFIAFWGYIAGIEKIGATFIPAGNMDTVGRIELAREFGATVFMSTPSYAIHVGETAKSMGIKLNEYTPVRLVVHTGEPTTPLMKKTDRRAMGRSSVRQIWQHGDRGLCLSVSPLHATSITFRTVTSSQRSSTPLTAMQVDARGGRGARFDAVVPQGHAAGAVQNGESRETGQGDCLCVREEIQIPARD